MNGPGQCRTSNIRPAISTWSPSTIQRSGITGLTPSTPNCTAWSCHPVDQHLIGFVRPLHRHLQRFGQVGRTANVIDMAVRENNLFDIHALLVHGCQDLVDIAARINHRSAHG